MACDSFHGVTVRGPGECASANDAAAKAYGKDSITPAEKAELATLKSYRGPFGKYQLTKEQRAREVELLKKARQPFKQSDIAKDSDR
jgi:hypothetical protein